MVWAAYRKPRKGAVTRSNSYDDESYLNDIIALCMSEWSNFDTTR
jgi:hypothetical protein